MKTGEERGLPELREEAHRWKSLYSGNNGTFWLLQELFPLRWTHFYFLKAKILLQPQ